MQKIVTGWINKNQKKLSFSVMVNAGILILLLLFFRPEYETNDDMGICNLVNGARGVYESHLVYSNYFLGAVLSWCYRITQRVPWYPLLQYATLFLSYTAVFYVIQRKVSSTYALWLPLPMLVFFSYQGYIRLQYTKTAGIAAAAGFFLLFYALEQEKLYFRDILWGYLLTCLGFLYRSEQFFAEAAVMSGIGVALLLELKGLERQRRRKRLLRYVGSATVLLLVLGVFWTSDRMAYREPAWQEYLAYNEARTELFDYGFPAYSENKEAYQALGISKTAKRFYESWNHMDQERFSTETMQELIKLKEPRTFGNELKTEFLEEFLPRFVNIAGIFLCALYGLYGLLWGRWRKSDRIGILYEIVVIAGLYLYLFYRGRYIHNRVDTGIWFAAILVVIRLSEQRMNPFTKRTGLAFVLSCVCVFQLNWAEQLRWNAAKEKETMLQERTVIETIHSDQEHLYLLKMGSVSFAKAYGVFDRIPYGIGDNLYPLGGWPTKTPVYTIVLERYGVENPFRDMIGSDTIYLIDQKIESTLKYLHDCYSSDASAEEVMRVGPYPVYRINGHIDGGRQEVSSAEDVQKKRGEQNKHGRNS